MRHHLYILATLLTAGAGAIVATTMDSRPTPGTMTPPDETFHTCLTARPDNQPPSRMTAGGTNLFGFVSSDENDSMDPPRGVYEIGQYGETTLVYQDPGKTYTDRYNCAFLLDGYLYGYAEAYYDADWNVGTPAFLKVNFETGAVEQKIDIDPGLMWVSPPAYNPEDGYFYFFDISSTLLRANLQNPTKWETVKQFGDFNEKMISLAYCEKDRLLYGITVGGKFASMDFEGNQTIICDIPDKSAHSTFQAAMTYSPNEDVFYWNYMSNTYPTVSSLYTITREGTFNYEYALDNNACFDWFVTPDKKYVPAAPESPVITALDFAEGALSGSMTFTMPEKMQNGNALPDPVKYTVTLDGETFKTAEASPKASVTVDFTNLESGNHEFGVFATVDAFSCDPVTRRMWIGNDTPKAPASVTLSSNKVSWEAVTEGTHLGYVDLTDLKYNVTITNLFGDTVFETETKGTSVNYTLENPDDLSLYTAYVSATSNGLTSTAANSAGVVMGEAMTPPVTFTPTYAEFGMMTQFDKNKDGRCWSFNSDRGNALLSGYSDDPKTMDDYIFLPAMKFESTERIYEVSLDASAWSTSFTEEYLDVVLATAPDYDGVIESLVERTKIPCAFDNKGNLISEWTNLSAGFKVYEPGIYYIGIHASSASDMAGILVRNISVKDGGVLNTSPAAVTDISATAAANGVLSANVSFTFPQKTVDGKDIAAGTELTATVESPVETVTVKGLPGAPAEASIATLQGDNEIGVVVANPNGDNSPRAVAKVFTGETVPSYVTGVKGMISDDMRHFTLYWTAPTEGVDGGYINPANLTYSVYVYDQSSTSGSWVPLKTGITECEYTFSPETQDYYRIAIEAVNIAGASTMVSGSAWVGPAYTLPYSDSFTNPSTIYQTKPWRIFTDGYYASWTFAYLKDIDAALYGADNNTVAMYCYGVDGTMGRVSMPRFATLGETSARISIKSYTGSRAASVTLYGYSTNHSDRMYTIGTLPVNTGEEIKTTSFDLPSELLGEEWVQVMIDTDITSENSYFAMTEARVDGASGVCNLVSTDGKSILTSDGAVRFKGHDGDNATICTTDGAVVASGCVRGNDALWYVSPGVYVVKAGQTATKVIVK